MPRDRNADSWRSPAGATATLTRADGEWQVELASRGRTERIVFELDGNRVRPRVCFGGVLRPMDVSTTPAAVAALVGAVDPGGHLAAGLATRLATIVPGLLADAPLTALVGAGAFPLLTPAYAAGRTPLDEIPRWAATGLAAATPARGATALFGPLATRPVKAAFGRRLSWEGDGAPPLLAVGAAVLGAPVLHGDDVAALLTVDEPPTDPARWPGPDEVARFHRVAPRLGRERVRRLLTDAMGPRDGLDQLLDALQLLSSAEDRLIDGVPLGLTPTIVELDGWLTVHPPLVEATPRSPRRRRPTAGAVAIEPAAVEVVAVPIADPPPAPVPLVLRANRPQRADRRARPAPESWPGLAPAAGPIDGRLRLVVPTEAGQLTSWGTQLRNCLAGFVTPVAENRTAIGAVEVSGRLRYALEVTPAGVLRQLFGKANTPVPPASTAVIVRHLADRGVIDLAVEANAHWR